MILGVGLTERERDLLTTLLRQEIKNHVMAIRNDELIVSNPVLAQQYTDFYVNTLKEKTIPDLYKEIKWLKNLVNKIQNKMYYKEDDLIQIE